MLLPLGNLVPPLRKSFSVLKAECSYQLLQFTCFSLKAYSAPFHALASSCNECIKSGDACGPTCLDP